MNELLHDLIGDWHTAVHAAVKAAALFLTALIAFRLSTRRALAQFAPFDRVAAVAVGAIVGISRFDLDAVLVTSANASTADQESFGAITDRSACPGSPDRTRPTADPGIPSLRFVHRPARGHRGRLPQVIRRPQPQ